MQVKVFDLALGSGSSFFGANFFRLSVDCRSVANKSFHLMLATRVCHAS